MAYTVVAGDLRGDVTEDIHLATFGEVFVQGSPGAIFVAGTFSGQYGTLVLEASGLWTYTLANTLATVQALGAGDVVQDAFVATSYLGDSIISDFIEIAVAGANDPAAIGGVLAATLDVSATDTVSGQAVVLDIDDGEKEFQAGAAIAGMFGTLQVSKSGLWIYSLSPASRIALLDDPKTVTEVFTLSSADGMTSPLTVSLVAPGLAPTPGPVAMIGTEAADTLSDTSGAATLIQGLAGLDSLHGGAGDDTLDGGAGDDTLDGGQGTDTAAYTGSLASYTVARTGDGLTVTDKLDGRDGTDNLTNIEALQFADMSVNLTVQALAASIPEAALNRLTELYVGFFARVPAANGMAYWIGQYAQGQSLDDIAQSFYEAGSGAQLRQYTGYWDLQANTALSDQAYVAILYRNVLGREGLQGGINFWADMLGNGTHTRGSLVGAMLDSAHQFKGDATWGWVADLLDARIAISRQIAVDMGLNYASTAEQAIATGMAVLGAVNQTPNPDPALAHIPIKTFDSDAAITLVGLDPNNALRELG